MALFPRRQRQPRPKHHSFSVPTTQRTVVVGPEHNPSFWNPNRIGARPAPEDFLLRLREVDPDNLVDIRWNPITERWAAFMRKPRFQSPLCQGWQLLMVIQHNDGRYMPLDERTLAALYQASGRRWGNGREYWLAIARQMEREQQSRHRKNLQDSVDRAMPFFEHSQISVSGCGKSSGSKFSTYHS